MTSIAEFTLPAADFPLGRVFEEKPGARLELDRVVPGGDTVMPYFWVEDEERDLGRVLAVFETLPELRSVALMEDLGERGLFRAEWKPEYMAIMGAIGATDVTVLSATGSSDGWLFELRAEADGEFAAFQQHCEDHDVDVTLTRLSRISELATGPDYKLTPEQREALLLAYEEGYYSKSRAIDQETLAARLGISRQAFSSRLRRGYRNLIESTIARSHADGG